MFNFEKNLLNTKKELGSGSFGTVYAYQKDSNDLKWVVKLIVADNVGKLIASFSEITLGFSCDHPCLVPARGYFVEKLPDFGHNVYIRFSRMKESLLCQFKERKRMNNPFTEKEIVRHFYSLVCGLKHLHNKRIYHGDIKHDNLLLDNNNNLKIADVGIAKYAEDEEFYQTIAGQKGTPCYSAPEILGEKAKKEKLPKADIWSLGVVILELCIFDFRLLNSSLPQDKLQGELDKLLKLINEKYSASVSPLVKLIERMLSLDPKNRPDLIEIKKELETNFCQNLDQEMLNFEKCQDQSVILNQQIVEMKKNFNDAQLELHLYQQKRKNQEEAEKNPERSKKQLAQQKAQSKGTIKKFIYVILFMCVSIWIGFNHSTEEFRVIQELPERQTMSVEANLEAGGEQALAQFQEELRRGEAIYKRNYSDGSSYEGQMSGEMRHGKGTYKFSNGDIYFGDWQNNQMHGKGHYIFSSGEQYSGDFQAGARHGMGEYLYLNGDRYSGNWVEDKRKGKGTFIYSNHDIYEGEFFEGLRHGKGKYTLADGTGHYDGEWKEGEKSGFGTLILGRASYIGEWQDDKPHGNGTMIDDNQNKYNGQWREGYREGRGVKNYADGAVYDGEWRNNQRHGEGTYTYANKDVYQGTWENDELSGKGVYKFANGDVYEGSYKQGERNGQGELKFANGDCYKGHWREGKRHGEGQYTYANGDVYNGAFVMNEKQGQGTYKWKEGDEYEGEWSEDTIHGTGKYTFLNGSIQQGSFVRNQFNSENNDDKNVFEL